MILQRKILNNNIYRNFSTFNYNNAVNHSVIPIIDIKQFKYGSDQTRQSIANEIYNVGKNIGFMYIKNSEIDVKLKTKTLEYNQWLFNLPIQKKQLFAQTDQNIRGYYRFQGVGYGEQLVIDDETGHAKSIDENNNNHEIEDVIEAFLVGNDHQKPWVLKKDYYEQRYGKNQSSRFKWLPNCQPNQWPATEPSENGFENDDTLTENDLKVAKAFRNHMNHYFDVCSQTASTIVSAIALSLALPLNHFDHFHSKNDHTMELKHYKPSTNTNKNNKVRMNEHADLSTLTLLIQNKGTDGLQLWNQSEWIDAPFLDDAILVNTGDVMERLSNGQYKSTKHRVVMNNQKSHLSRYSTVFFYVPNWEKEITNSDLMGDLIPFS
ncbi:hypothetical protein PPL_07559 [Heterostelium album PN500]|uniref:Fe2OG dioxygenase domain-containing protein n=1 Tax=Heterostelium pallidum (strain ATCC 26659 / Pp 5 / PN500) TaxID=670386 RepID=D3BGA8_HETP5|nr:hypothetical protein PPL_07559 [Heterostelium album PN500]EFA79508.1 hypothetical protein PPL_07559 [Heterostelium album PN500]|eukprot:XP_020431629.1 hypothetical protein PPL_07559 [Heterostelium album PN500]